MGALGHVGTATFLSICQTRGSEKIISACTSLFSAGQREGSGAYRSALRAGAEGGWVIDHILSQTVEEAASAPPCVR